MSHVCGEFHLPSGARIRHPLRYGLGYRPTPPNPGPLDYGPCPAAFGHSGSGMQIGFCDPVNQITFGRLRNQLAISPTLRSDLISSLYECVRWTGVAK